MRTKPTSSTPSESAQPKNKRGNDVTSSGQEGSSSSTDSPSGCVAMKSVSKDGRLNDSVGKDSLNRTSTAQRILAGDCCSPDVSQKTKQLAKEFDEFIAKGIEGGGDPEALTEDAIADLQLHAARKLRQLLPTNKELLNLAQERNWIPMLLGWLNLHDRPAVQVEALLALTDIASLCAQQSYLAQTQSSAAAVAAQAAAAAAASNLTGSKMSIPDSFSFSSSLDGAKTPGSVPFPPLSFSQSLSPEALAAFDASLSSTIQQTKSAASKGPGPPPPGGSLGLSGFPPSSLSSSLSQSLQSSGFSSGSLPFDMGGSSSSYLPPPTPVDPTKAGDAPAFPQQLSPSSQHLLLRHADAIPTLISLLSSPNREVYEQAMWILGSIAAGDSGSPGSLGSSAGGSDKDKSIAARDVILAAGIMAQLLRCLEAHPNELSLQRIGSWTLSNLVEGIFQQASHGKGGSKTPDYSSSDEIDMDALLPTLYRFMRMTDAEVLSYTCWTLSHLCDSSSHISAVVTSQDKKAPRGGLVPRLVELLLHTSWRVTKPALRTIGNIVCAECGDDSNNNSGSSSSSSPTDYTEIILYCGAVPRLMELVTHSNREIQKEACWTLSNIAAGTIDQIQAVIDSGAIPPLVKLVSDKNTDQEVRSEACWVVLNATSCGSDSQIEVLVDEGCVSVLGVLLDEPSMVMMALEGLERVLQVEEARETARREKREKAKKDSDKGDKDDDDAPPMLVSSSLIQKALDKHNSSAVNKRASRIWKQHFVSCALCNESFSKHRTADATFCEECKCYVCSKCDCKVYHLSYQEELWAASEEKTEAKQKAKKSKNKKKKQKQKKAKQLGADSQPSSNKGGPSTLISSDGSDSVGDVAAANSHGTFPPLNELSVGSGKSKGEGSTTSDVTDKKDSKSLSTPVSSRKKKGGTGLAKGKMPSTSSQSDDEVEENVDGESSDDGEQQQPPIDFVLYLQQTGSIISLAKLMDALDYGDGYDYDNEEFDDKERQLIRNLQTVNQEQATN